MPKIISKQHLRHTLLAARNNMDETLRVELSKKICNRIAQLPEYIDASCVLLYSSIGSEVDLSHLTDAKKTFVYPKCLSNHQMIALKPYNDEWEKSKYGIDEPVQTEFNRIVPEQIDIVICPCVAFDKNRNRLGYGGGYYDRYLPKCINAKVIAVAYQCQFIDNIPCEAHDVKPDKIVTERSIY